MIALASDCLLFQTPSGESIPCSADMVSDELTGVSLELFDPEFVNHAANAVFHYFKHELGRQTVSLGEFAGALENVLRGFAATAQVPVAPQTVAGLLESDLALLAAESSHGWELVFFPRLRAELRRLLPQLEAEPYVLRFHGLRDWVMHLLGARRWSSRCQNLEQQVVAYLRECLSAEAGHVNCALVVE
jgi:hypothetical protein